MQTGYIEEKKLILGIYCTEFVVTFTKLFVTEVMGRAVLLCSFMNTILTETHLVRSDGPLS